MKNLSSHLGQRAYSDSLIEIPLSSQILLVILTLSSLRTFLNFLYTRSIAEETPKVKFRHAQNGHFRCDLRHMGPRGPRAVFYSFTNK